jgi:molybdopterin-guanine dinucleotide biosynthesis protein MobB
MNKLLFNAHNIPVLSVVAWSGSGKTTFLEKLIPEIKKYGLSLAIVKHDAHGFDLDRGDKDTGRMTAAGADVTAIFSSEKAAIMENRPLTAEEVVDRIRDVDLILTEGCKTGPWRKLALLRVASGKPLPVEEKDCIAIITDAELTTEKPVFGLDDVKAVAAFVIKTIRNS